MTGGQAYPGIISTGIEGTVWGISHPGGRERNEDALLILPLGDAYLLAVADGLGGHEGGELASKVAVEALRETFERGYTRGMEVDGVKDLLRRAYEEAHRRIVEMSPGPGKMGTTLTAAFVGNGRVVIANTGDSRAYLVRNGEVVTRTRDHSVVGELLERGVIGEEEVHTHPLRHVLTKALGIELAVDTYTWELRGGDVLLLSTDGLHDVLDDGEIGRLTSDGDPRDIAERLVGEALKASEDNITVVVFRRG
ncbi:serine/threonine-protein phosphatase [Thermococcus sp. M36]|uniref:PP2C family protein-serine/threonine phosphatase n=1 Tax=Thermococcus sp. M36 TaxID=1638261 RepID=UPI00143A8BB0|nr:protein phosphatase 2C domain-containing protein [Thermococcus sp. M36]NJE04687.1 serine/threonine-protein phosphatase [Thermococcus sp. M36]